MTTSAIKKLKPQWRVFAENYIRNWNGTEAYKKAYPNVNDGTARANAARLLTNASVASYIDMIQKDLSKIAGVSALRNMEELRKIAYSSLHNYQSNWMTLKEWDKVSEDDKAAISEVNYTTTTFNGVEKTTVKFKLHSKQAALDSLNKMLGVAGVEKVDLTSKGKRIKSSEPTRIIFE